MFAQFRASHLTIWLKQQQFASIVIILYTSFEYTISIILFTRNVSSHKADWILSKLAFLAVSWFLYRTLSSLMNTLELECLCLCEICINVNKCSRYCCLCILLTLSLQLCYWMFTCLSLFYTDVVAFFFCLFVDDVNKPIIFVYGTFVYHFNKFKQKLNFKN